MPSKRSSSRFTPARPTRNGFSVSPDRARCRRCWMATSRSGIRLPSSNTLAERFPEARLWPEDRASRAHARAISAEMHSGFAALRNECGMNLHRPVGGIALSADARADIARVQQIWIECRERYGQSGPFLFGAFGGADAMFAPVVHRFRTYAIEVASDCARLYGCHDGAAGVSGMDQRGAGRNPPDREIRDRVIDACDLPSSCLDGAPVKRSQFEPSRRASSERTRTWEFSIHWKIHRHSGSARPA